MKAKQPKMPVSGPGAGPGGAPAEYPEVITQADVDAYEQLARIRAELGDEEGKVVLKRRNQKGQLGALGVMATVDFSIERVISDWGGGRYVAVVYRGEEKLDTITFEVDESIPARVPREVTEEKSKIPALGLMPSTAQDDPKVAALERSVMALQESIKSQNDLLKTVITASLSRPAGDGNALDIGMKIAELVAQRTPAAERPSFADLKDIFLAGIEAKQAAEGGGDEGYGPVLKAFAGPIAKVLDSAMGADRRRMMAGSVPVTQPQQVAPPPAQPALPPGQAWLVHLQPHLNTLLGWAKAGKDPELYAEVILDNIDPGAQMEIAQAALDPEFVTKTLAALPMFVPYSAWATAVLTNMKELLTAPPEEGGGDSTQE